MTALRAISMSSRTEEVRHALREAILGGELEPGTALVERDLAATLGVSKTPVREALKMLSSSGLIELHPYRGASVRRVDPVTARSLFEVRLLLEPAAVRAAVAEHDDASLLAARKDLRRAAGAIAAGDVGTLSLANRRFHRRLYAPCRNEVLRSTLDALQDHAALVSVYAWRRRQTFEPESAEHEAILEAVEARDAAGAEERMYHHIAGFLSVLDDLATACKTGLRPVGSGPLA